MLRTLKNLFLFVVSNGSIPFNYLKVGLHKSLLLDFLLGVVLESELFKAWNGRVVLEAWGLRSHQEGKEDIDSGSLGCEWPVIEHGNLDDTILNFLADF